jgi:peptidyl-prolyl cis-trans isomerase A (cyclophilin A)
MIFVTGLAAASLLLSSSLALAQQSTPPAAPPSAPTTPTASTPANDDLPDSPTSQVRPVLQPTGATAVFDTSMGRITCRFFDKQAPDIVANFVGLATGTKDWQDPTTHKTMHHVPLYNGTEFHRVIPMFMIQGGDPTATGTGDPGYYVKDEIDPDLNFDVPGRLAMANSGPNTNGSQFFITENAEDDLDQKYSIFGQCDDSGVLVVKTIARVERGSRDKPLTPVLLNKVTIVQPGQPLPPAPVVVAPPPPPPPQPGASFGIPGAPSPAPQQ